MKSTTKSPAVSNQHTPARVSNHGVDPKTPVWRFMNLARLFDLLNRERLFFTPVNALMRMDPYECSRVIDYDLDGLDRDALTYRANEMYPFAKLEAERTIPNKDPEPYYRDKINQMSLEELRALVLRLSLRKRTSRIWCSCWYINDCGGESDAMWRLYAQEHGVAIQSNVEKLASSLKSPSECQLPPQIHLARIRYLNDEDEPEAPFYAENPWMIKRKSFSHEQELRLFTGCGDSIPIDVESLIQSIVITPLAADWAQDSIKFAIEAIFSSRGRAKPTIIHSQHLNAPDHVFRLLQMPAEKIRLYRASVLSPSLAMKVRRKSKSS